MIEVICGSSHHLHLRRHDISSNHNLKQKFYCCIIQHKVEHECLQFSLSNDRVAPSNVNPRGRLTSDKYNR